MSCTLFYVENIGKTLTFLDVSAIEMPRFITLL